MAAKLAGDYNSINPQDPLFAGMTANGFSPLPGQEHLPSDTALTFGAAVHRYLEQKKTAWGPKTVQAVGHALRLAGELFGSDQLLMMYSTEDKKHLRDVLAAIPPNHKIKAFSGLTASEAATANKEGPRLSPKSQEKSLEFVGGFFTWALNEGYIEKVPGPGIKALKAKKYGPGPAREPYSNAELEMIFGSPVFSGCRSRHRRSEPGQQVLRDGYYWIPLIALYSGMRLGEIVQLRAEKRQQRAKFWPPAAQ